MQNSVSFPSGTVQYMFEISFEAALQQYSDRRIILITDENIAKLYGHIFSNYTLLILPAGEGSKSMDTISTLATQLLAAEATRTALIIGIGGGVVTDITGFLASIYMRGVSFGFVPTSLLAMVDASIGGKNGVDLGIHKNMLGTITQPEFISFDTAFLQTLPDEEWSNGFAEIIKYACIFDAEMFDELSANDVLFYKNNADVLSRLIQKCVTLKNKTVQEDEQESGARKLLNFGHTTAHAIEKQYSISHGKAVAIGMVIACQVSERVNKLDPGITARLKKLLQQYNLPCHFSFDLTDMMRVLRMDKKRRDDTIDFIMLEEIGKGVIHPLPLKQIEKILRE